MVSRGVSLFVAVGALASIASAATIPFSTGFEASEGYTAGTQLATNPNWTGDGQDTTGWQITANTIGGSGPKSGAQWVLTNGATASASKFQWTVTPVTDFSVNSTIEGSADVKIVQPGSGTITRNTYVGIQMYTAAIDQVASLLFYIDAENLAGLGANRMLLLADYGDASSYVYDLGVSNVINTYVNLKLSANFVTGTVRGYINGNVLPDIGGTGGFTDFHDFDLTLGSSTTTGGTRGRGGFDNYSITAVPAPGSLALVGLAGLVGARRRRK